MSSEKVVKTVPFTTGFAHGTMNIISRDRARVQELQAGLHPHGPRVFQERRARRADLKLGNTLSAASDLPDQEDSATDHGKRIFANNNGVIYSISVGVGEPAEQYTLLVDTGSSITWIGADKKYNPTPTSKPTGKKVHASYGSGWFTGEEYLDTLSLGPDLVIQEQYISVASSSKGISHKGDGILGIGPVELTRDIVPGLSAVPTVVEKLFEQKEISSEIIGISFSPTTKLGEADGELTFGGVDNRKFTGEVNYVPVTSTYPAGHYWGIEQTITYGADTLILPSSAGVVDTGSTLLHVSTDAFEAYKSATSAILDEETDLLTITQEQFDNLQSLFFKIGEVTYELTANAQIWPRTMNDVLGGKDGVIYLVVCDSRSKSGSGLDFINGYVFLQRFYSVYDTENSQVGFATTEHTMATTN